MLLAQESSGRGTENGMLVVVLPPLKKNTEEEEFNWIHYDWVLQLLYVNPQHFQTKGHSISLK